MKTREETNICITVKQGPFWVKVLKISKVTGTGLAPSFGGYFKVSPKCIINSSEVLYLYSFLLTRTHFYYCQV